MKITSLMTLILLACTTTFASEPFRGVVESKQITQVSCTDLTTEDAKMLSEDAAKQTLEFCSNFNNISQDLSCYPVTGTQYKAVDNTCRATKKITFVQRW